MANRSLDALSPRFRPHVVEFLAQLTEAGIPVMIIETLRSQAQHDLNVQNGVSWTKHSKHIDGDAIDICPYELYTLNGPNKLCWDSAHPVWERVGQLGEHCGMRWGGRWKQRDMGHFEFIAPVTGVPVGS